MALATMLLQILGSPPKTPQLIIGIATEVKLWSSAVDRILVIHIFNWCLATTALLSFQLKKKIILLKYWTFSVGEIIFTWPSQATNLLYKVLCLYRLPNQINHRRNLPLYTLVHEFKPYRSSAYLNLRQNVQRLRTRVQLCGWSWSTGVLQLRRPRHLRL